MMFIEVRNRIRDDSHLQVITLLEKLQNITNLSLRLDTVSELSLSTAGGDIQFN